MSGLPLGVRGLAWLGAAILWVPLLVVAAFSFNAAPHGLAWEGFTTRWYTDLLRDDYVLEATRNTFLVALVSTALSTLLGTSLALALERFPWPPRLLFLLEGIIDLPVVTPDIVIAAALVIAFAGFRAVSDAFQPGIATMTLGHATFQVSFVALVVRGRLQLIGSTLSEAGHDLYATRRYLLWRVTLPLLLPGIVAGAVLAFTLSLDDFVISFLTCGDTRTLPIYIYSQARKGLTPLAHALSTLVVVGTALLVLGLERSGTVLRQEKPSP